ncbi:DUF2157 domain-containing protein [Flavobacterium sp. ZT3R18]|uniref:DUF2157 domain-containing protein n=1 Tax=Flavobacterium sp. ZT3R18 TaxID=2594429 RepID=UPI00163D777E|nr:DUF2157 domain-containing protein [Flavobacterium sp. ZT3R18]
MNILKDIPDLITAGVITQETADRIQDYYKSKAGSFTNRLFIVFGILGSLLLGLGIILILAHNWDELSKETKTIIAFLPLLSGQVFCGYTLLKKQDSVAWRESSSSFLFFAVGAIMALIGQIYNIPGDISTFLLTWMLLCLPLVYLMNSSITSLLYIVGITYYAFYTGWGLYSIIPYQYWVLISGVFPHYYNLYKKRPESNFMIFHNWLIPISVSIVLITVIKETEELMFIAYMSLFGFFYLVGNLDFFARKKLRNNGYTILGSLGTISLLLFLSFDWFWEDLKIEKLSFNEVIAASEFYASVITSLLAGGLFYIQHKNKNLTDIKPLSVVFILFIITFIIGLFSPIAVILINIFVLAIGILTISDGAKQNNLSILNFGLLIITAQVAYRFFDGDLSFVIRGLLFMSLGIGFFASNYWLLKKRKKNE